jgi:large subunit ribosomal protein L3
VSALFGKKLGMTSVFDDTGVQIPCTVIEAGPCSVLKVKSTETDGYSAVQVGYEDIPERKSNKPLKGIFKKAGVAPKRYIREIRVVGAVVHKPGDTIDVSVFAPGDTVAVTGVTKGKGFQGAMRRHGFSGAQRTHGQSDRQRAPGSVGSSSYPSRVYKGMRMAGRMGGANLTVRNLRVVKVIPESNLLLIRGAVPGAVNGFVKITKIK